MSDTLTALDATFLELEEQNSAALMSIGGVMIFEPLPDGGTPTIDEVCAGIGGRLGQLPRYSQRLSSPHTGGFAWPRWVTDEHFDVRDHVRRAALARPGGPAELCDWAADFYSHPLDRTRPLWEIALIEGLEDGGWALAHKTHHCLVDGVGSVDVVQLLLDADPGAADQRPSAQELELTPPYADSLGLFREAFPQLPQPLIQAGHAGMHAAEGGLHAVLHPRAALAQAAAMADLLVRDEIIAAPRTSLNAPIGSGRRFAVVHASLEELRAVQRSLGGSVNDAVLAACATGLRKLLLERGETPPAAGLRAMVPTNLRAASERLALGNRVSSLFVPLPVAEPVAHERHRRIVASTRQLKSSGAAGGASTVLDLAALAPPLLHALVARSAYATRLFNVTITNVPGPPNPLYALGARLRDVQPIVPLAAGHTIGIAAFSYDGQLTFGLNGDAASTPDLAVLAYGIGEGIEELLGLASWSPRA